ncbi:MAG: hypothetical protein JWO13_2655 [Acidobacteriales bacterium]|nr:hypothetical protein [Terriglobales bacterium]
MDDSLKASVLERLKHAIQALALPAELQLALFPDFVVKTDELVLDFDLWKQSVLGDEFANVLTHESRASLNALDEYLSKAPKDCWTDEALEAHAFWQVPGNWQLLV